MGQYPPPAYLDCGETPLEQYLAGMLYTHDCGQLGPAQWQGAMYRRTAEVTPHVYLVLEHLDPLEAWETRDEEDAGPRKPLEYRETVTLVEAGHGGTRTHGLVEHRYLRHPTPDGYSPPEPVEPVAPALEALVVEAAVLRAEHYECEARGYDEPPGLPDMEPPSLPDYGDFLEDGPPPLPDMDVDAAVGPHGRPDGKYGRRLVS